MASTRREKALNGPKKKGKTKSGESPWVTGQRYLRMGEKKVRPNSSRPEIWRTGGLKQRLRKKKLAEQLGKRYQKGK